MVPEIQGSSRRRKVHFVACFSERSGKVRTEKCPVCVFSTEATFFLQDGARSGVWGTYS